VTSTSTSTEAWCVAEMLACVAEFIKRSKREEFPEGYAVSHVGSTGAQNHIAEARAAKERSANARHRELRARAFAEHILEAELFAALAEVDATFQRSGE
jgi:hypothetical protein